MLVHVCGNWTEVMTNIQNICSINPTLTRLCDKILKLQIIYSASETLAGLQMFHWPIFLYILFILGPDRATSESLYYYQTKEN